MPPPGVLLKAGSIAVPGPPQLAQAVLAVAREYPLRPVQRGPPGLLAPFGIAPHFDMAAARRTGGGTVAWFPAQRHRAWLPRMVQAASGRPGHPGHSASRTHIRVPGVSGQARAMCGQPGDRHRDPSAQASCRMQEQERSFVTFSMRTPGTEVVRSRWGSSLAGGGLSEAFPVACVVVLVCCTRRSARAWSAGSHRPGAVPPGPARGHQEHAGIGDRGEDCNFNGSVSLSVVMACQAMSR